MSTSKNLIPPILKLRIPSCKYTCTNSAKPMTPKYGGYVYCHCLSYPDVNRQRNHANEWNEESRVVCGMPKRGLVTLGWRLCLLGRNVERKKVARYWQFISIRKKKSMEEYCDFLADRPGQDWPRLSTHQSYESI